MSSDGAARYVLTLDEGTSSARAVLIDPDGHIVSEARRPVVPVFPHPGWVELDPARVWESQRDAMLEAMSRHGVTARELVAIGITTSRETVIIWDRRTGEPIHRAISWMSNQTEPIVRRWREAGWDEDIRARTGVYNNPFFSASKLTWLLENVPGARERAERGELAAGTLDTWLLWQLTAGRSHRTDHSEASRTGLFNLTTMSWDADLCARAGVPLSLLPEAVASDARFGDADPAVFGELAGGSRGVPVTAVLGDQQAGMFGQACFEPGSAKNTYGTAGVLTVNSGDRPMLVDGQIASVAWTVAGRTAFEVEGTVFSSGQTLGWLRDRMKMFSSGDDIERLARLADDNGGVYFVPAFNGLGSPYWDRGATATISGLTLESGAEHVVRAAVEAMAYQTRDNIDRLDAAGLSVQSLKVDGGAAGNDLLCQFQADVCGIPVLRAGQREMTALGVGFLAGIGVGVWKSPDDLAGGWTADRIFEPGPDAARADHLYAGWCRAVAAARTA